MSEMNPTHALMLGHVKSLIDNYEPKVEAFNAAQTGTKNDAATLNLWIEKQNASDVNTFTNDIETFVRSDASLEELVGFHNFAKSLLKLTTELLHTHMMTAPKSETVNIDDVTHDSLKAQYEEISVLFDAVRKLNIPVEDMVKVLPIRMGKAARSGQEIPKLNIVKPKSERKQVRENSQWFKLVVNGEVVDSPIGLAVKETFKLSLAEFMHLLKTDHDKEIYDLVDGEEIEFNGFTITCAEVD